MLYEVNRIVAKNITIGFDCLISSAILKDGSSIEDKIVRFDCEEHDQNNFVKQQVSALSGIANDFLPVRGIIEGETTKREMVVSIEVYKEILGVMATHILINTQKGWDVKELIEAALTKEELEAITWSADSG